SNSRLLAQDCLFHMFIEDELALSTYPGAAVGARGSLRASIHISIVFDLFALIADQRWAIFLLNKTQDFYTSYLAMSFTLKTVLHNVRVCLGLGRGANCAAEYMPIIDL
ncbi:hypothetical protein ACJX0J_017447, partial [Zea mays]